MNLRFVELARSRAAAAVAAASAASEIAHAGLKGHLREIVLKDLLRPFLPLELGVGSGEIIDAYGGCSTQQDIVIYDRTIAPPIVFEAGYGVFPVESVLHTIEVKSIVTLEDIREVDQKQQVRLRHAPDVFGSTSSAIEDYPSWLFGFSSDQKTRNEYERYTQYLDGRRPSIQAFCVVGQPLQFWSNGAWQTAPRARDYDELIEFTMSLLQTSARIRSSRRAPDLRYYIRETAG